MRAFGGLKPVSYHWHGFSAQTEYGNCSDDIPASVWAAHSWSVNGPALVTFDLTGKNSQRKGNGVWGRGVGTGTDGGCTAASECIFLRGGTADV